MFKNFFNRSRTTPPEVPQEDLCSENYIPEVIVNFDYLNVVYISFLKDRYLSIYHIQKSYDGTSNVMSSMNIEIQHKSQYDSVIQQYKKYLKERDATNTNNDCAEE